MLEEQRIRHLSEIRGRVGGVIDGLLAQEIDIDRAETAFKGCQVLVDMVELERSLTLDIRRLEGS
jgi:hypothetical protein